MLAQHDQSKSHACTLTAVNSALPEHRSDTNKHSLGTRLPVQACTHFCAADLTAVKIGVAVFGFSTFKPVVVLMWIHISLYLSITTTYPPAQVCAGKYINGERNENMKQDSDICVLTCPNWNCKLSTNRIEAGCKRFIAICVTAGRWGEGV